MGDFFHEIDGWTREERFRLWTVMVRVRFSDNVNINLPCIMAARIARYCSHHYARPRHPAIDRDEEITLLLP